MAAEAFVAGSCLAVFLVACQGPDEYFWRGENGAGQAGSGASGAAGSTASGTAGSTAAGAAGNGATGTAGSIVTGSGGNVGTGAGGSVISGAGGSSAGNAGGGATGTAGRGGTGAGGTTGGRGGTTGTAGTTGGRGGASGTGGGAGGRAGAGGASGRGGGSGTIGTGTGGRAGATGTAGATGAGGTSGGGTCSAAGRLDCTATGAMKLSSDGTVVDFSTGQWSATTARWCDAHGLGGTLFAFQGTGSTAAAAVDTTAQNLKLNLMVSSGQYAGGGVYFDECVDARAFNAVQFTASITAGSLTGCVWQVQLQTQDERPTTATNPSGGTCNATTATCARYPAASMTTNPTATATAFTARFTAFNNPSNSTTAAAGQVVGLQWQVNSNGGSCTVELRIDNVKFVTM